jgi:hypothetical protein
MTCECEYTSHAILWNVTYGNRQVHIPEAICTSEITAFAFTNLLYCLTYFHKNTFLQT